jgi:microcystin-dependent protein
MIAWTLPADATPESLYRWVVEFVQQQRSQQAAGEDGSGGTGGSTSVPIGGAVYWLGDVAPEGFLSLSGQVLPRSGYPGLFGAFGTKWNTGGESSEEFRLPNANGRVPLQGETEYGGEASRTLTMDNLPAAALPVTDPGHDHAFAGTPHNHALNDPQHNHALDQQVLTPTATVGVAAGGTPVNPGIVSTVVVANSATGITAVSATAGGTISSETTGVTVELPGGGESFSLLPPFFGGIWIVRAQ